MAYTLNIKELNTILMNFYEINGIRVVIFDSSYNEIAEYPPEKCDFCRQIRKNGALNALCNKNDIESFEHCDRTRDTYIYKCHAGLVEAVTPLICDGKIIGYMMLGQITDIKSKERLSETVESFNKKHVLTCDISGIKFRSRKQIEAAAGILKMCAEYIILKELIRPENERIVSIAKEYIKARLAEEISIAELCSECSCSRTRLYEMFRESTGMGVAHYINEKRLLLAKSLLKTTELSVSEISARCGFWDYNYFSRVYKKRFGISPRKERQG